MFLPSHSLDTVSSSDMLFCFEVLSKDMAKERVVLLRVQQVIKKFLSACQTCLPVCADAERAFFALCFHLTETAGP